MRSEEAAVGRSEAADTQDANQTLLVVDEIGDGDPVFEVVLEQGHAGDSP